MGRLIFLAFYGTARSEAAEQAHESPPVMWIPLVLLAVGAVTVGALATHPDGLLATFLEPISGLVPEGSEGLSTPIFYVVALLVTFGGLGTAWFVYGSGRVDWLSLRVRLAPLHRLFANGWYIDQYYAALIVTPGKAMAAFTAYRIDAGFIDGIVNGIGSAFRRLAGVGPQHPDGLRPHVRGGRVRRGGRDRRLRGVPPVNRLLTIVTFLPLVGLVVIMVGGKELKDDAARWITLMVALATFVVSLVVLGRFDQGDAGFQMVEHATWVKYVGLQYLVGIDGISIWMVLLTTFMFPIAMLASWKIDKDVRLYMACVAGAGDGRARLVRVARPPAVLPVLRGDPVADVPDHRRVGRRASRLRRGEVLPVHDGGLGVPAGRRSCSCTSRSGAVLGGANTFDLRSSVRWVRRSRWRPPGGCSWRSSSRFAVKVPVFPLHTWLPDAHTEAPTAGSVLLAAILLKMGTYGLIRVQPGAVPRCVEVLRHVRVDPGGGRHRLRRGRAR